jgi:hypothetical protein
MSLVFILPYVARRDPAMSARGEKRGVSTDYETVNALSHAAQLRHVVRGARGTLK